MHRNLKFGYHAIPSMAQVHMHAISDDFDSPCLKTKKHWNSFTTDYFIDSQEILNKLAAHGRISEISSSEGKRLLDSKLRCHKCDVEPPNIPKLKLHIRTHLTEKP
ncbi:hypothetical protein HAZT_HAZT007974 [Hyalella azteca]|uniref:C2H2-type domain-containing protein n=1 Tax=Hyalella azteca TaxID=294128 RepID=A0A6A0H2Y1_HYAAZ|nr:hypothetical protein HAZT_HAZT007974 [Hyalella azteca]